MISNTAYNLQRPDIIILAITSQIDPTVGFGETALRDWRQAGLLKPSVLKPIVTTIERSLVLRTLGRLTTADRATLARLLDEIFGQPPAGAQ